MIYAYIYIKQVQAQLDDDHYGLQKVKTRLVEFLAVRQLHERLAHAAAIREELAKHPNQRSYQKQELFLCLHIFLLLPS